MPGAAARPLVVLAVLALLCSPFACAQEGSADARPSSNPVLETVFSQHDLAALERLVATAQANSPEVGAAAHAFTLNAADTELPGRLGRALEVGVGADVAMSPYAQASPSYRISVSLDVVELLLAEDRRAVLGQREAQARAQVRLAVVEAFTRYVVAHSGAESAAQALETSEAQFRVVGSRLEVGEATVNDQLAARAAVSSAAVTLLTANAELIVALEALAAVVGLGAAQVAEVMAGAP